MTRYNPKIFYDVPMQSKRLALKKNYPVMSLGLFQTNNTAEAIFLMCGVFVVFYYGTEVVKYLTTKEQKPGNTNNGTNGTNGTNGDDNNRSPISTPEVPSHVVIIRDNITGNEKEVPPVPVPDNLETVPAERKISIIQLASQLTEKRLREQESLPDLMLRLYNSQMKGGCNKPPLNIDVNASPLSSSTHSPVPLQDEPIYDSESSNGTESDSDDSQTSTDSSYKEALAMIEALNTGKPLTEAQYTLLEQALLDISAGMNDAVDSGE